jgi:hypothetical protein
MDEIIKHPCIIPRELVQLQVSYAIKKIKGVLISRDAWDMMFVADQNVLTQSQLTLINNKKKMLVRAALSQSV